MRNNFRGHRRNISVGWRAPKTVRGLVDKLQNVLVYSLPQIESINPSLQGVTIASSVGYKKRLAVINKAREKGIMILNIKNIDDYIERHNAKRVKKKPQEDTQKVKEVKTPEQKPEIEVKEEIKKEETKEELDKLLTKRA